MTAVGESVVHILAPKHPLKFIINIHDSINFPSVAMMEMHLNTMEYS